MARAFRFTFDRRIVNAILKGLLKLGLEPDSYFLLTVPGRKSGKPHAVPVVLIQEEGQRWLVAPYGAVDWVKNARAAGYDTLTRGNLNQEFVIIELSPQEAAPILKVYLHQFPITQPYFDARPDSPLDEFILEAESRPVFKLQTDKV
jgi:hypothetical protein